MRVRVEEGVIGCSHVLGDTRNEAGEIAPHLAPLPFQEQLQEPWSVARQREELAVLGHHTRRRVWLIEWSSAPEQGDGR